MIQIQYVRINYLLIDHCTNSTSLSFLYHTLVQFGFSVVVDTYQKDIACIVFEGIAIAFVFDLGNGAYCVFVVL